MGKTRHIGNNYRFNDADTELVCKLYQNRHDTVRGLTQEQKRVAVDLIIKATNFSFVGGSYQIGNQMIKRPSAWIEKETTDLLINLLAIEIGVIEGTLSMWETRNAPVKALSCCNLSKLQNLNLGNCREEDLSLLLGHMPDLRRLRLRIRYCLDEELLIKFITSCPKLETLCLNTYSYRNDLLIRILNSLPNLKVLKISHFHLSENDFKALKNRVAFGSLHTLHFAKISMPRKECWAELLAAGLDKLEGLVLDGVDLDYADPRLLLETITSCTQLRRLHLNSGNLQEHLNDSLFKQLLINNPKLEEIRSYWLSNLTDVAIDHIVSFGSHLKRIYLHQSDLTLARVESFANNDFWTRPNAEFISISGNKVDTPQDPNSCVSGGNHYCYVRKGYSTQFQLSDSHQRFWDGEQV